MQTTSDPGIGRRITRYGMLLTLSGVACKIFLLVYTVLAVEILGREQFGRIEFFVEMAIIFSVLADFGLEQTVTRELTRRRDELQPLLYSLCSYRIVVSFVGALVMFLFLLAARQSGHTWSLILAATVYFAVVYHVMLIRAAVRSMEWLSVESLANVMDKVVHVGLAIFLLFTYPNLPMILPMILFCYCAGSLVSLSIYWAVILRCFGWQPRAYSTHEWIDWQKMAVPIGLSAACILLLHREDTVMVNWIRGDDETGLYRAPYRFLEGLFLFPQVLAISAYPVFSKLFHEHKQFVGTARLLLRGLFTISLPIAVGGIYVAQDMLMWLTPGLGAAGGRVFSILLWSLPSIYANFILGTILNATNRGRLNFRASAWGLFSNAVLNIPAIYTWGAYGACVVTVLTQTFYGLLMLYYLRDFHLLREWKRYASIVLSSILMLLILVFVNAPWYTAIPLGVCVYAVFLFLLRGVTYQEIQKLKHGLHGN